MVKNDKQVRFMAQQFTARISKDIIAGLIKEGFLIDEHGPNLVRLIVAKTSATIIRTLNDQRKLK